MAGKLDNVDHHLFERVWKELSELAAAERHFNTLESSYRMLASTWLLATFGGAGFVLTADRLQLPFDKLWLVVAIGLAGCSGITLLWNLDLMVYHQLLHANFREGERLEGAYDWVPKVRTRMRASQPGRSALRRVIWFYIGGVT
ncbi:MAG TPA: hypothetical protein VGW38_16335, partial [Chloroflexota bacterium]|nr:hypothetical protein [Chloroflexota bacterium]